MKHHNTPVLGSVAQAGEACVPDCGIRHRACSSTPLLLLAGSQNFALLSSSPLFHLCVKRTVRGSSSWGAYVEMRVRCLVLDLRGVLCVSRGRERRSEPGEDN